jgi:hypothetical protein
MTIGENEKPIKKGRFSQISCKMGRMKFEPRKNPVSADIQLSEREMVLNKVA